MSTQPEAYAGPTPTKKVGPEASLESPGTKVHWITRRSIAVLLRTAWGVQFGEATVVAGVGVGMVSVSGVDADACVVERLKIVMTRGFCDCDVKVNTFPSAKS